MSAIAVAATADALRGGGAGAVRVSGPDPVDRASAELRRAGIAGTLMVSDPRCARSRVELPALRLTRLRGLPMCATLHSHPPPRGCRLGNADLVAATVGTAGTVVAQACAPGLFRELRAAVHPRCDQLDVESIAWPRPGRVAAVVRCGRNVEWAEDILFLLRRPHRTVWRRFPGADLWDLRTSPRGTLISVRSGGRLLVVDSRGRPTRLPAAARRGQAIAWSPDERWTAVATGAEVIVFATGDPRAPIHRLPLPSVDVAWR